MAIFAATLLPLGERSGPSAKGRAAKSSIGRDPAGAAAAGACARTIAGTAAADAASARNCLRIMLLSPCPCGETAPAAPEVQAPDGGDQLSPKTRSKIVSMCLR